MVRLHLSKSIEMDLIDKLVNQVSQSLWDSNRLPTFGYTLPLLLSFSVSNFFTLPKYHIEPILKESYVFTLCILQL